MDEDVKICPECGAEYFSHVEECKGCEVRLVWPGEVKERRAEKAAAAADSPLVCVEEGTADRLAELAGALRAAGIEPQILRAHGGKSCSSGSGLGLFVPQALAKEAVAAMDEYWLNLHPELKEMEERLGAGLCPACGAKLTMTTRGVITECQDCGLNLGGPPGSGSGGGDGCGTC